MSISTNELRGHLAMLAFSGLVAGSFALGIRVANDISPAAFTLIRFVIAVSILATFILAKTGFTKSVLKSPWRFFVLGGCMAVYFVLMFEGLKIASSVSLAAVFTFAPLLSGFFGYVLMRQKMSLSILIALIIGGVGALWVVFEGNTDINLAFRYTKVGQGYDLGFLGAFESDEAFSQGRDYFATRYRVKKENLSFGYLGTFTKNEVLGRNANVNTVDMVYRPTEDFRLYAILLNSIVEDNKGYGLRISIRKQLNQDLSTGLGIYYLDKNLDINDMGYLMRNDWIMIGGRTQLQKTDFNKTSKTLMRTYQHSYGCRALSNGDKEGCFSGFEIKNQFKNTSQIETEVFFRTNGRDNLITRGSELAPYIKLPQNYGIDFKYIGQKNKFWQWTLFAQRSKGSENSSDLGWRNKYYSSIKVFPLPNLTLRLSYSHEKEANWLNWIQDNFIGAYEKTQRNTNFSIKYFKGNQHELRVKTQLVAFTAKDPHAYLGSIDGRLNEDSTHLNPFSLGQLAFQVRYRYEIMPLAYLYAVYTRGGKIYEADEEDDLGTLYKRPWEEPTKDNFTLKVRYRF